MNQIITPLAIVLSIVSISIIGATIKLLTSNNYRDVKQLNIMDILIIIYSSLGLTLAIAVLLSQFVK